MVVLSNCSKRHHLWSCKCSCNLKPAARLGNGLLNVDSTMNSWTTVWKESEWVGDILKILLKNFPSQVSQDDTSSSLRSSTPLFFLQVGDDPLQFSAFFPFYRLQDLSWTLGLAHWGLASECLAVLLDEGVLVLPTEINTAAHIWHEIETMIRMAAGSSLP